MEKQFRYWDKEKNILQYLEATLTQLHFEDGHYCGWFSRSEDSIVRMQYIWKKDKNGKKIYEGDVVRIKFDYSKNILDEYKGSEIIYVVDLVLGDDMLHNLANIEARFIEIIGNKRVNPELLE